MMTRLRPPRPAAASDPLSRRIDEALAELDELHRRDRLEGLRDCIDAWWASRRSAGYDPRA